MNSFPDRLKAARKMRCLSQGELSAKTRIQAAALSHFETGGRKPSFDNLRIVADALDVSADYLLGRTDDMEGLAQSSSAIVRRLKGLTTHQQKVVLAVVAALKSPPQVLR